MSGMTLPSFHATLVIFGNDNAHPQVRVCLRKQKDSE
jgi:hypothetical protein